MEVKFESKICGLVESRLVGFAWTEVFSDIGYKVENENVKGGMMGG